MIVMGVLAVRLQSLNKKLEWDGQNMKFTNIGPDETIRTVVKDGFEIHDGHPTFKKDWTEPVNAKEFTDLNDKQLLVVLFDPYKVTKPLIKDGTRYDQKIVDFLDENNYYYFDMNMVHAEDFKSFDLSVDDYFKRYFIGHYKPAGNHFFAYSIKDKMVNWLDPKPITYRGERQNMEDFDGYLEK